MDNTNLLPIKILHDFTERMERLQVNYALTGSMAMMNYSVYRFTADLDVILELEIKDVRRIIETFEPDYYVPHNAVGLAISSRKMFNVIHQETAFKIDCIIRKSNKFQTSVFERRQQFDFFGKEIWIISLEDLILSKLWWAKDSLSEKQFTDVKNLLRNSFDQDYVSHWAIELGVEKLLEQCQEEIKK